MYCNKYLPVCNAFLTTCTLNPFLIASFPLLKVMWAGINMARTQTLHSYMFSIYKNAIKNHQFSECARNWNVTFALL